MIHGLTPLLLPEFVRNGAVFGDRRTKSLPGSDGDNAGH